MSRIFGGRMDNLIKSDESGRVGYFILWLMGAPVGLLLLLWVIFGNNLFGAG